MLYIIRNHPYIVAYIVCFLILFFIFIFALDTTLSEALLGSTVLPAIGVGGIWWKQEGLG
jgi:hypothetical protein